MTSNTAPTAAAPTKTSLALMIDKLLEELHRAPLSAKQEGVVNLLQSMLEPLIPTIEGALTKHVNLSEMTSGIEDVFHGLVQIESGYKALENAFKHPSSKEESDNATQPVEKTVSA